MQEETSWKHASQPLGFCFASYIYGSASLVKIQKFLKDLEIPINSKHTQYFPNQQSKPLLEHNSHSSVRRKNEEEKYHKGQQS